MARKTFNQKLAFSGDLPKVKTLTDPRAIAQFNSETLLIAPPLEYDQAMRQVGPGQVTTMDRIRQALARRHGAGATCPLTAGMFVVIAANASEERLGLDPTPWWRTLKPGGELNPKYPGGVALQQSRLEAEGHRVVQRGARAFVVDYEAALSDPSQPLEPPGAGETGSV